MFVTVILDVFRRDKKAIGNKSHDTRRVAAYWVRLALMLLVPNLASTNDAKKLKRTKPLAHGYSSESA